MKEIIDRPGSKNLGPLKKLLPFARPYIPQISLALLFLALGAAATLYLPVAVRHMIDLGFSPEHQDEISRYFIIMFVVAVTMAIFTSLRYYWVSWLGQRIVADLRDAVYKKVLAMSPEFFETTRTGEVLSRINTDTTLVETVVGSTFSISLRSMVMLIGSIVMMIISSPRLAGMILLVIPVVIIPIVLVGRLVRKLSKISQDRIADCSAMATETINAVQTVQAYAQEKRETDRFGAAVIEAFLANVKRIRAETFMSMSIIIMIFGGVVLVLWAGARSVIDGTLSAGVLSQFVLYAIMASTMVGALASVIGEIMRAAGALERISELLAMTPAIQSPKSPTTLNKPVRGTIRFSGVQFAYPARPDTAILTDINMHIGAGETVALVGPSGAGKTTLFQLMMRFYDPGNGSIEIDGTDIRAIALDDLRSSMALVSQDVTIFSADALENIRYGVPDQNQDYIEKAAKAAHADEFIQSMDEGYNSFLGERGVRLSGGQAQRLSIARALVTDPPVLLLDEATSSLDAQSERLVQEALDEIMKGRTTLVIAHRLATVRKADRILVLDGGKIVAEGSHDELVQNNPLYASLAELQFLT